MSLAANKGKVGRFWGSVAKMAKNETLIVSSCRHRSLFVPDYDDDRPLPSAIVINLYFRMNTNTNNADKVMK